MGGMPSEEHRAREADHQRAAGRSPRNQPDERGANRVDYEIGDAVARSVATPKTRVDHEAQGGKRTEFAQLQAPHTVGPLVHE